ncbi:MAG: hypothetical protein DME21_01120 [Verrucomicrobia bacterium]|nr:MAG: hypothetical protein DME21_01120 [Verrucomicrobiota bacterium]
MEELIPEAVKVENLSISTNADMHMTSGGSSGGTGNQHVNELSRLRFVKRRAGRVFDFQEQVVAPAILEAHAFGQIADLVHLAVELFQVEQDLLDVGVQILFALDQLLQAHVQIHVGRIARLLTSDDGLDVADDFFRLVAAGHLAEAEVFQIALVNRDLRQMAEETFQLGAFADEFASLGGVKLGVEV